MVWYQNSYLLEQSERRPMLQDGSRHSLIIKNFQKNDFGNYRYVNSEICRMLYCLCHWPTNRGEEKKIQIEYVTVKDKI